VDSIPITLVDAALVLVLLLSALLAFARGFVHEVLSVGAWIGAIVAVIFALPYVRPIARQFIELPLLADVAAGGVVFVVAMVALSLVTRAIARRVRTSALNAVDRSLGFVFGLVRGALIVCLAYIAFDWLVVKQEQPAWVREAKSMPLVEKGSEWLKSLVNFEGRSRHATGEMVGERLRRTLETERMVRDMINPEPKSTAPIEDPARKGYTDRERRELERLLDGDR
jgi:membrane protein required for colicin V production